MPEGVHGVVQGGRTKKIHPFRTALVKNELFFHVFFSFFVSFFMLKWLSPFGRSTFAVPPLASPPSPLTLRYVCLKPRNASGHSDAQHKDIETKQTQFMTDADDEKGHRGP